MSGGKNHLPLFLLDSSRLSRQHRLWRALLSPTITLCHRGCAHSPGAAGAGAHSSGPELFQSVTSELWGPSGEQTWGDTGLLPGWGAAAQQGPTSALPFPVMSSVLCGSGEIWVYLLWLLLQLPQPSRDAMQTLLFISDAAKPQDLFV